MSANGMVEVMAEMMVAETLAMEKKRLPGQHISRKKYLSLDAPSKKKISMLLKQLIAHSGRSRASNALKVPLHHMKEDAPTDFLLSRLASLLQAGARVERLLEDGTTEALLPLFPRDPKLSTSESKNLAKYTDALAAAFGPSTIADAMGCHPPTVSNVRNGTGGNPGYSFAVKVAKVFGEKPEDVLSGEALQRVP